MENNAKRQKKQFVREEDMPTLLERYTPTTVFALLREVSEVEYVKIDWNEMVKKTSTGISNAREYQMLWRHLAYRDTLLDLLDDASEPLDDDSDLECELKAIPAVNSESSAEAAAYVKVLMASGASNDPNGSKDEGPLIIDIPKGQMLKAPENSDPDSYMEGTNIAIPVWVQKQPLLSTTNGEILDSSVTASANLTQRRRKPWSPAEDKKLIAAVQKYGEGNWSNISKGEFKDDRKASQLSQRWANIRKQVNLNVGNSSQLSEAQLATRHAVSMALDNRPKLNAAHSNLGQRKGVETSRMASQTQSVPPSQHDAALTSRLGPLAMSKPGLATKKPSTKPVICPVSMGKAAGACNATPSDDASRLDSTPSNNADHIMLRGSSVRQPIAGNGNSLPSNVHFIRTGLATKPLSSYPTVPANFRKTSIHVPQPISVITTSESGVSSGGDKEFQSNPASGAHVKSVKGCATFSSSGTRKLITPDDQSGIPCKTTGNMMEGEQRSDGV